MSTENDDLLANVGSDKAIQNPQEAIVRKTGMYHDRAAELADAEKLPLNQLPMAPAPTPFKGMRKA